MMVFPSNSSVVNVESLRQFQRAAYTQTAMTEGTVHISFDPEAFTEQDVKELGWSFEQRMNGVVG